ncbi:MarR family winged helix-turn-helix transcriptional regulator [Fructobacillus sp. M1-13]|uniref:Winged helix-turn-helix transcriptional regulator n=1 Tax=Fructobacillus papyriferae TaxID=2713171 RepID=A0ABS5QNH1_9LACO|nr:MarR family winged helix-turn-helix transcriptional regulator [Fructobacillus papyriferae]MBS9334660.1 winged helix-turn-helix transcriptional regulator [Fructobacillus papyriferae]MCD2158650.1 MarR family winged helix-turn-helix transcriptional regulator [Fructobacillus papyriferae]
MPSPNQLHAFQNATSQAFFALYTDWYRQLKSQLRRIHLTHPQVQILAALQTLNLEEDEVTQVMVAKKANIDPMTASAIITKLARADYLDRFPGKKKQRTKALRINENGQKQLENALTLLQDFEKEYWKDQNPNRQALFQAVKDRL